MFYVSQNKKDEKRQKENMHILFNRFQDPWTEETKWHLGA
jgi:hypothetical protein